MSRSAFNQCAREVEEREEYLENVRRERSEELAKKVDADIMALPSHTPGPWKLCSNEQGQNFQIIGADSLPVAVMATAKSSSLANWGNKKASPKTLWLATANEREQANARLIAAAPELLEALSEVLRVMVHTELSDFSRKEWEGAKEYARAVITKARGA